MTGGNMEVMYGIFLQDTSRRMTSDCGAPFSLRVARASAGVLHHLGAGITKRRLGGKNHPLQFGQQPCVSQVRFGRFARHLSHRVKALLVAFTQPVIKDRGNLQVLKPCYSASFPAGTALTRLGRPGPGRRALASMEADHCPLRVVERSGLMSFGFEAEAGFSVLVIQPDQLGAAAQSVERPPIALA